MPHQNPDSSKATTQHAATDSTMPNDPGREQNAAVRPEPRAYAAPDVADSTLAPPAAGEVEDYADEGDPLDADDVQLGGTHRNRPRNTELAMEQGPKTRKANRKIVRTG